jgi:hypothetical protein
VLIGTIINTFLKEKQKKITWLHFLNWILLFLLSAIVHDAVMKHTFLSYFFL